VRFRTEYMVCFGTETSSVRKGILCLVPEGNWGDAADTGKQFVPLRLFRTKGGYPSEGIYLGLRTGSKGLK
jgi:hypothetical protein